MHHQNGSKRQKFNDIITIADRIHTISINAAKIQLFSYIKAVNGKCRPGNSARTKRHHIRTGPYTLQSAKIALQHIEIRQQMVCKGDRLSTLQMRITGHQCFIVLFGNCQQRLFKLQQQFTDFYDLTFHIHMHIQSNLVITAAGSMQTCPRRTDPFGKTCFDVHMDVF